MYQERCHSSYLSQMFGKLITESLSRAITSPLDINEPMGNASWWRRERRKKREEEERGSCALCAGTQNKGEFAEALSGRQVGWRYQGVGKGWRVLRQYPESYEGEGKPLKCRSGGPLHSENQGGGDPSGPQKGGWRLDLRKGARPGGRGEGRSYIFGLEEVPWS